MSNVSSVVNYCGKSHATEERRLQHRNKYKRGAKNNATKID